MGTPAPGEQFLRQYEKAVASRDNTLSEIASDTAALCPYVLFNFDVYEGNKTREYSLDGENASEYLSKFDLTYAAVVLHSLVLQDRFMKGNEDVRPLLIKAHTYEDFTAKINPFIHDELLKVAHYIQYKGGSEEVLGIVAKKINIILQQCGVDLNGFEKFGIGKEIQHSGITRKIVNLLAAAAVINSKTPGGVVFSYLPDGNFNLGNGYIRLASVVDKRESTKSLLRARRLEALNKLTVYAKKYLPDVTFGLDLPDQNGAQYDMLLSEEKIDFTGAENADPAFIALLLKARLLQENIYSMDELDSSLSDFEERRDEITLNIERNQTQKTSDYASFLYHLDPGIINIIADLYSEDFSKGDIISYIMEQFEWLKIPLREHDSELIAYIAQLILLGKKLKVKAQGFGSQKLPLTEDKGSGFLLVNNVKHSGASDENKIVDEFPFRLRVYEASLKALRT